MFVIQSEAAESKSASGVSLRVGKALIRRITEIISPRVSTPSTANPKKAFSRCLPA
jgi:hypothetical protein